VRIFFGRIYFCVTSEIQLLVEPPQQRRRLVLQPRTIPKENDTPSTNPPSPARSENGSDEY
jgi:hypothetical protein